MNSLYKRVHRSLHATATGWTEDSVTRKYAGFLVAGHAVVLAYFVDASALNVLSLGVEPICWPYFEACWQIRLTSSEVLALLVAYAGLILVSYALLFEGPPIACWAAMVATNIFLFVVMSLDYRLRSTELYMLFSLNAAFLLIRARRWSVPLITVSFYFWAGILKLNYEWLSGAALYQPLFLIPPAWTAAMCTYVVLLEILMIWGLLSRNRWAFWATLGQLALFHIQSLSQIHWFYPALMATMLAWFILEVRERTQEVSLRAFATGRAPWGAYVATGTFALLQLTAVLQPGDATLDGGRLMALQMFESKKECLVEALLHREGEQPTYVNLKMANLTRRRICDPVVYYSRVTALCRSRSHDPGLLDVGFRMAVKRSTDATFTTVLDVDRFCDRGYDYSMLFRNRWFRSVDGSSR